MSHWCRREGHQAKIVLMFSLWHCLFGTLCSLDVVGKYREFHKLYNNKQFTEAGALLLSLLTARVAPKR